MNRLIKKVRVKDQTTLSFDDGSRRIPPHICTRKSYQYQHMYDWRNHRCLQETTSNNSSMITFEIVLFCNQTGNHSFKVKDYKFWYRRPICSKSSYRYLYFLSNIKQTTKNKTKTKQNKKHKRTKWTGDGENKGKQINAYSYVKRILWDW